MTLAVIRGCPRPQWTVLGAQFDDPKIATLGSAKIGLETAGDQALVNWCREAFLRKYARRMAVLTPTLDIEGDWLITELETLSADGGVTYSVRMTIESTGKMVVR